MKKIVLLSLIFVTSILSAGNAPEVIQKEFDQRFPGASDVIWERENPKGWIAEFVWNGQNIIANYSFPGAWIETKTQIPIAELPEAVTETITSFYPDWKILVATRIENSKSEIQYKTAIQKEGKMQEIVLKAEGTLLLVGLK